MSFLFLKDPNIPRKIMFQITEDKIKFKKQPPKLTDLNFPKKNLIWYDWEIKYLQN